MIYQAQARQPYFKKFAHGWAIEEFLKSQLKNRRAYARKNGFLEDIGGSNIQVHDDDIDSVISGNAGGEDKEEVDHAADVSGSQQEEPEGSDIDQDMISAQASDPEDSDGSNSRFWFEYISVLKCLNFSLILSNEFENIFTEKWIFQPDIK